jgi:eukaryotic-like serine/threonine-protein kinase
MICPNCQAELREGVQFCSRCGARVVAAEAGGAVAGAPSEPPATAERTVVVRRDEELTVISADALTGQVLDGKYELLRKLGEGGMGAVYRARRVHIADEVAVKILHPKFVADESAVERFRREARAAAQLHHHNVVTIHDYGETEASGQPLAYIVMELVPGVSLRELLRREGRLEPARAVELMRDVCAGVAAAHRRHIVHRDLKPDNIIVLAPDDDRERETVKVVDFGIAKLRDASADHTLTAAGAVVGTPHYMSPEQCLGEPLDSRADVYSLGALFYEMIAGAPPFTAATPTGVISKHLSEPPPRLPADARVPAAVEQAVHRALAKDPKARQADASEFARELMTASSGATTVLGTNAPPAHVPTHASAPTPTSGAARTHDAPHVPASHARPPHVAVEPPPRRKSRAPFFVGLFVLCAAAIAAAGFGFYLFMNSGGNRNTRPNRAGQPNAAANANALANANANTNANAQQAAAFQRAESKLLADTRLAEGDLAGLDTTALRYLLNTVYARHGRPFGAVDLRAYFRTRPWYRPSEDYSDDSLTAADRANVRLLVASGAGPAPTPTPDQREMRREVADALDAWVSSTEDHDLDEHMSYYADTLESYYNSRGVARDNVRSDRGRAFDRYEKMNVDIDNVRVTLDETGVGAQVVLDKKWKFEGERCSQGKVQQQLRLARIDGRWRITSERDLKVYPDESGDCD